jgi:uncharacterized membrane protein YraQ (UPF0718 family)
VISPGFLLLLIAAVVMSAFAISRRDGSFHLGLLYAVEQFIKIAPRMIVALIAASFMVKLVPTEIIGRFLGDNSGITGIFIGSVAGLIVPAGPVISFAIAAALAAQGASVPALIAFITAWSLFSAHRIMLFEIPLLGPAFVRMRMLSVMLLPVLAGTLALIINEVLSRARL